MATVNSRQSFEHFGDRRESARRNPRETWGEPASVSRGPESQPSAQTRVDDAGHPAARSSKTDPAALDKGMIRALHSRDRSPMLKHHFNNLALVGLSVGAVIVWNGSWWALTPLLWIIAGHFYHTKPLTFHDTSHGTWHPVHWKNELMGMVLGTLILVPLSVYRYAHALHHAYMSSERDPELWPFVIPGTPRWARILAAAAEIVFGCLYVPFLFLRSVLVADRLPRGLRVRMTCEYLAILAFWSSVVITVQRNGWWEMFLVGFVAPTAVAGMYQTLNKYTEHLGLLGDSVLSGTRTVADTRSLGRVFSSAVQNVDHHGTHHRYARIPYYNLPAATPYVYAAERPALPVYPSYSSAFRDMLTTLGDPKAGRQWMHRDGSQSLASAREPLADAVSGRSTLN